MVTGNMRKPSAAPEIRRQLSKRVSVQVKTAVPVPRQSEAMRVGRKAMPYIAICLFFLTFVVFMWVVPCNWGGCPSMCSQSRIKSWQAALRGMELEGAIVAVPGLGGLSRNLVFMARCRVFPGKLDEDAESSHCTSATDGGLLSLAGSTGAIAWWRPTPGLPRDVNCSLIDVNKNGVYDCIVVGDDGLLEAIDPVTGVVLWHVHTVNALERLIDLIFPLILPDLDGDGVEELLVSCRVVGESFPTVLVTEHNNLALVSGKTGRIIGRPFRVATCSRIHSLQLQKHLTISYVCQDDIREESFKTIGLQVLYTFITNQAIVNASRLRATSSEYKQHRTNVNGATETNRLVVNGRRLSVENRGHCPLCDVYVQVADVRPEHENMLWNKTYPNTHAMLPVALMISNATTSNGTMLPGTISGFVLKFWHWVNIVDEGGKAGRSLPVTPLKSIGPSNEEFTDNQYRSSARSVHSYSSIHQLQERAVLITFRDVGVDMRTVSQHNITQLCSHVGKDVICQPDLAFQEQSLLIADLGLDGDHELVSFFSTYESGGPDEMSSPWLFRSEVHVIPVEAELLREPSE